MGAAPLRPYDASSTPSLTLSIVACSGRRRLRLAASPLFTLALRRVLTTHTTQGDAVTPLPGGQEWEALTKYHLTEILVRSQQQCCLLIR